MVIKSSKLESVVSPSSELGPSCEVGPSMFCELAISSRRLIRIDNGSAGVKGLQDIDTGERFVVTESSLIGYGLSSDVVK